MGDPRPIGGSVSHRASMSFQPVSPMRRMSTMTDVQDIQQRRESMSVSKTKDASTLRRMSSMPSLELDTIREVHDKSGLTTQQQSQKLGLSGVTSLSEVSGQMVHSGKKSFGELKSILYSTELPIERECKSLEKTVQVLKHIKADPEVIRDKERELQSKQEQLPPGPSKTERLVNTASKVKNFFSSAFKRFVFNLGSSETGVTQAHVHQLLISNQNPRASADDKFHFMLMKTQMVKEFATENLLFVEEAYKLSKLADTTGTSSAEVDQQLLHMVETYVIENDAPYEVNLPYDVRKNITEQHTVFVEQLKQVKRQESLIQSLKNQGSDPALILNAEKKLAILQIDVDSTRASLTQNMAASVKEVKGLLFQTTSRLANEDGLENMLNTVEKFGERGSFKRKVANFHDIMVRGNNGWQTAAKTLGTTILGLTVVGSIGMAIAFLCTSSQSDRAVSRFSSEKGGMADFDVRLGQLKKYEDLQKKVGLKS